MSSMPINFPLNLELTRAFWSLGALGSLASTKKTLSGTFSSAFIRNFLCFMSNVLKIVLQTFDKYSLNHQDLHFNLL